MGLQESGEMYLETILILSKKNNTVRSIDVSDYMGYSKPSISRAVGLLKQGGFITMDRDGSITLTETGRRVAQKIYDRHTLLTDFLIEIGVDAGTASEDACKMEHDISDQSFEALRQHILSLRKR